MTEKIGGNKINLEMSKIMSKIVKKKDMEKKIRKVCIVCGRRRYIEHMTEIKIIAFLTNTTIPISQKDKWICLEHK